VADYARWQTVTRRASEIAHGGYKDVPPLKTRDAGVF
jgi:hypothetical protein